MSSSVARAPWLLLSCLALPCLLRASRAVFPPASLAGLFAIRSALSSYRLAPRSSDKWGGAIACCVSVLVRLGRCCLLLVGGGSVDVAGWFPLAGVALCRRVDGVGCLRDFRRPRCLPWTFLSVWCVSLAPVACFAPRCRRWSSWADCHRVLSSWLRLVVDRRGSSPFRLACPRVRCHPCSPRVVSSAVDRSVDRSVDRLFAPSCLSCGGTTGVAGSLLSRAWPLLAVPPSWFRSAPVGAARLIRLLAYRLGILRGGVAVGMAGRGCLPLRSRGSCGVSIAGEALRGDAALAMRLVVWLVAPCACLYAGVGVSFLRCGSCPDTHFAPSPLLRGGAIFFLPLRAANR